MHPLLRIRALAGTDRDVFQVLSRQGGARLSQVAIAERLGPAAPSQPSISRALTRLVEAGIVAKAGRTRDASFAITPEAAWFAAPAARRAPVLYDPLRFASYDPVGSPWLPSGIRDRMAAAVPASNASLDPDTFSREIAERFLIEMSWASSALEGNTYSLLETEVLIKYAERAVGRSAEEATMILNHKDAIGWLVDGISTVEADVPTAQRLHALLMRTLVRPESLGAFRDHAVGVTNTAYQPLDDRVGLGMGLGELVAKAAATDDPFEASFALLVGTAYLQGFADGNKRLGRLLCNIPLLKAGLPPLSFVGVDRQAYAVGMISWYELADPTHVAAAVGDGYVESAPAYAVAAATRRIPRSVEIRERRRFDEAVRNFVSGFLEGGLADARDYALDTFSDIEEDDRAVLADAFEQVVDAMNDIIAPSYRVPRAEAEAFREARDRARPRP